MILQSGRFIGKSIPCLRLVIYVRKDLTKSDDLWSKMTSIAIMAPTLWWDCMDGRRWLDAVREPAWKLDAATKQAVQDVEFFELVGWSSDCHCWRTTQSIPWMNMFRADTSPWEMFLRFIPQDDRLVMPVPMVLLWLFIGCNTELIWCGSIANCLASQREMTANA